MREAGHQLNRVQEGFEPDDWKPMTTVGVGVKKVRIKSEKAYRVMCVATYRYKSLVKQR